MEGFPAFGGCNHAGERQLGSALVLEEADSFDCTSTSGEHGVEDNRVGVGKINRGIWVIDLGFQRRVVSAQANVSYYGLRNNLEEALCQSESRSQDGNENGRLEETVARSIGCVMMVG